MPSITFDKVTKSYGTTPVLREFSVSVPDGEFLVLLGPSGCGKSTLLRMIAGLTDITSGTIAFDDEEINRWDVRRRNVAFVFQSYALYPQLTVRHNIAFPMLMTRLKSWHHAPIIGAIVRRRLMRTPEIRDKVEAIAAQLKLTELLDRRPAKLSGGQRQRVALARSLVREPSIYLLDEPLSNLDATLRTQMRTDIITLHRSVAKTFVFVTHDQVEALTMASTIIVMNDGVIQQVGTPDEVYDRPQNTFVARFVGSPPMNLIDGEVFAGHHTAFVSGGVPSSGDVPSSSLSHMLVGIRPEHLLLSGADAGGVPADIEVIERTGAETIVGCRLAVTRNAGAEAPLVFARARHGNHHTIGDRCSLQLDLRSLSWFDRASGKRVDQPVPAVRQRAEPAAPDDTVGSRVI
jgi:multiple sugar transport system ATP-binding protein